jgi:hypothetical protein
MRAELERDMKLMGCIELGQLSREALRFRLFNKQMYRTLD